MASLEYNRFYDDFDFERDYFLRTTPAPKQVSGFCVSCMNALKKLGSGKCSRCKKRNSCKDCLKEVRLKTLGEKDTRMLCVECLNDYRAICNTVKKKNFYGFLQ
jgi:hypothetical protein